MLTLRQVYCILIETKEVVSDLLRKYKTEWWQRKIRDCEGRGNEGRAIAYPLSGTVRFYTSTINKRAARPKLYTKSLTRDLKLMYSRLTLVRISIKL